MVWIESGGSLTVEYESPLTPMVPAHLSIPFDYRSMNMRRNLWVRQCVSSWWHLDWFGYLLEMNISIWFTFKCLTEWLCHLFYFYWLMGKGTAYGGLPFLGTGCPVPDVANNYLIWNAECMGYCFYSCPPAYDVSAQGLSFWKTDWTSCHGPHLYHIYILYSAKSVGVVQA